MGSPATFHFQAYGAHLPHAVVDPNMILRASRLLTDPRELNRAGGLSALANAFYDLAQLVELSCLYDKVLLPAFSFGNLGKRPDRYSHLANQARASDLFSSLNPEGILVPFELQTIDDLQTRRLFAKWRDAAIHLKTQRDELKLPIPSEDEQLGLLAGCLAEELTGVPHFPNTSMLSHYVPTSALAASLQRHSLLLEAYARLRDVKRGRDQLRRSLGTWREPLIPPIFALVLERMSTKQDLVAALLETRQEMQPLRSRMADLSSLASSDVSMDKWERETAAVQQSLNDFAMSYAGHDARPEIAQISPSDCATLTQKVVRKDTGQVATGELEFQLTLNKLLASGLEAVAAVLRRRRVRPLHRFGKRIRRLANQTDIVESLFGIEFTSAVLRRFDAIEATYEMLWMTAKSRTSLGERTALSWRAPDPSDCRKGPRSLLYIEDLDFEYLVKVFGSFLAFGTDEPEARRDSLLDFASICLEHNRLERAERAFRDVLETDPDSVDALHGSALIMLRRGKLAEAEHGLLQCIRLGGGRADHLNDLGVVCLEQGQERRAEDAFRRGLAADPGSLLALCNLASIQLHQSDYEAALEYAGKARELAPEDPTVHSCLGRIWLEQGEMDRAEAAFRTALLHDPSTFDANISYGRLLAASGRSAEAIEKFDAAGRSAVLPRQLEASLFALAHASIDAGDYSRACMTLSRLATLCPNQTRVVILQAQVNEKMEEWEVAAAKYSEAFKLDPTDPGPLLRKGTLYLTQEDYLSATASFEKVLDSFPKHVDAELGLALALWGLKQWEGACDYFERCLDWKDERLDGARLYNCGVEADQAQDYEIAIRLYKLYLRVSPGDANAHANLAAALLDLERAEEAVQYAERAVELNPSDVINLNTLGCARYLAHDQEGAAEVLRQVLLIDDKENAELREQAERILEDIEKNRVERDQADAARTDCGS